MYVISNDRDLRTYTDRGYMLLKFSSYTQSMECMGTHLPFCPTHSHPTNTSTEQMTNFSKVCLTHYRYFHASYCMSLGNQMREDEKQTSKTNSERVPKSTCPVTQHGLSFFLPLQCAYMYVFERK